MIDQLLQTTTRLCLVSMFCVAIALSSGCKGYGGGLSTPQEEGLSNEPSPERDTPEEPSE